MFKNLKKKIEEVGATSSTIGPPSTLGSSLSSLRRSESRTSAVSGSRESLQSESNLRTIHTCSINDDHSSKEKVNWNVEMEQASSDLLDVSDITNNVYTATVADKQPLSPIADVMDLILTENESDVETADISSGKMDTEPSIGSFLISEPSATDVIDLVDVPDTNPVMVPLQQDASRKPDVFMHELSEKSRDLETTLAQLQQRDAEIITLKNQISSRDLENLTLKKEIDRFKDIATKNRLNEEKLSESISKMNELQQKIAASKLEGDSWKIAHDQAMKRLKEYDAATTVASKKFADLEAKFAATKNTLTERQKEIQKYQEENGSVKATVALLENQLDKLLADYQAEKALKETSLVQLQDQNRLLGTITEQTQEINRLKQEKEQDIARIRQDKDQELSRVRQVMEEASRRFQVEAELKANSSLGQLREKESLLSEASEDIKRKDQEILELQSSLENLQVRVTSLEGDLEGKESNLAIFRRRAAKETETKLRERDKQIANLERQVEELTDRVSVTKDQDNTDETSHQYMKNVILKFVAANSDERMQMLRAVSVLLKLTHVEEEWLKETLAWKQSWLPGPRPAGPLDHQLPYNSNGHS